MALLDLVALGTVADVVPLVGLNRAFVRQGLAVMSRARRVGLRRLLDVARLGGPPRPYHLGYLLGPRINAGGRIGDAALGARLLIDRRRGRGRAHRRQARPPQRRAAGDRAGHAGRRREAQALASVGVDEEGASVVAVAAELAPGRRRPGRLAAEGALRPPGLRLRVRARTASATGSGRSVAGRRYRPRRAGRRRGGHRRQGRRPRHGGRRDPGARAPAAPSRPFWRSGSRDAVGAGAAGRQGLSIDAALTAGGARPTSSPRIEAAGPFGSGHPEPCSPCPSHRLVEATEVGQRPARAPQVRRRRHARTASPSGPWASRSARRCSRRAASVVHAAASSPSTAGRAPNASSSASPTSAGRRPSLRRTRWPRPSRAPAPARAGRCRAPPPRSRPSRRIRRPPAVAEHEPAQQHRPGDLRVLVGHRRRPPSASSSARLTQTCATVATTPSMPSSSEVASASASPSGTARHGARTPGRRPPAR